jgi:hypothetical protein
MINCLDSTFCIPGVEGLPRTKGIVITREIVRDYRINSELNSNGTTDEAEIRRNRRWTFKLRAPVLLKDNIKIAAGLKYFVEEHNFENPESLNNEFYKNLEDRPLRSLRADVFILKPTLGNKYFILRISGALNGDFDGIDLTSQYFKFSIAPLIGWKRNKYLSYAVGFAYSEIFGRRSIYPVFSYNHTFSPHWGIESILPAELKLRYNTLDQKNFFYFKAELAGSNYTLNFFDNIEEPVFLQKSEVRFLLNWEREIYDFLWFGVEAGMRKNINFDLSENAKINAEIIVDNVLNEAFFANLSIFIVPPRKFLK